MKIPRAPEGDETHSYGLREVETMLAVPPEPAATVCAVAAFAGLRRSQLRGLRWEDYDGDQGHAFSLGRIQQRTENQAQQIAGASHSTAAGDTRGAQTQLRESQGRANVCQRKREADEPEQRFESANPAGAESLAFAGNGNSVTLLLRIHTSTRGMVVYLSGTGSTVFAVDSLPHSTVSEWMT